MTIEIENQPWNMQAWVESQLHGLVPGLESLDLATRGRAALMRELHDKDFRYNNKIRVAASLAVQPSRLETDRRLQHQVNQIIRVHELDQIAHLVQRFSSETAPEMIEANLSFQSAIGSLEVDHSVRELTKLAGWISQVDFENDECLQAVVESSCRVILTRPNERAKSRTQQMEELKESYSLEDLESACQTIELEWPKLHSQETPFLTGLRRLDIDPSVMTRPSLVGSAAKTTNQHQTAYDNQEAEFWKYLIPAILLIAIVGFNLARPSNTRNRTNIPNVSVDDFPVENMFDELNRATDPTYAESDLPDGIAWAYLIFKLDAEDLKVIRERRGERRLILKGQGLRPFEIAKQEEKILMDYLQNRSEKPNDNSLSLPQN